MLRDCEAVVEAANFGIDSNTIAIAIEKPRFGYCARIHGNYDCGATLAGRLFVVIYILVGFISKN